MDAVDAVEVTDEELEALALAADPDAPLPEGAAALPIAGTGSTPLPGWYMPPAAAGTASSGPRRRAVVWGVVLAFAALNAVGLCSTYGTVGFK